MDDFGWPCPKCDALLIRGDEPIPINQIVGCFICGETFYVDDVQVSMVPMTAIDKASEIDPPEEKPS